MELLLSPWMQGFSLSFSHITLCILLSACWGVVTPLHKVASPIGSGEVRREEEREEESRAEQRRAEEGRGKQSRAEDEMVLNGLRGSYRRIEKR